MLEAVAAAVILILLSPFLYYLFRTFGKSLHWRFRRDLERLTAFAGMEQYPTTDRDGRLLAFEARTDRFTGIEVLDLTSGERRVVSPEGVECRYPRVSLDGRLVFYEKILARTPRRRSHLAVHDLETGAERALGEDLDFILSAAANADGSRIAVCGAKDGTRKVILFEEAEGGGRPLVPGDSEEIAPALSEAGERLAFLSNNAHFPRERFTPCIADFPSGTISTVEEERDCRALSISGDGRILAYEAGGEGPSEIRVLDVARRAVASLGNGFSPVLSHDGKSVLFDRIDDAYDLCLVDLETGAFRTLLSGNPYPSRPFFSHDARKVIFCSGVFNPLSRTGDTDIFSIDLEKAPRRARATPAVEWKAARIGGAPRRCEGRTERGPYPRNSMWVASYYVRNDGTRKPLEEQDGDPIELYSERLACMIDRVKGLTGSSKVNVVCHCMGGLVAKGAIQYFHDDRLGYDGTDGIPAWEEVNRLVTLGSPLRGNSFFGVLPLMRALRVPYFKKGFTRQAFDMVRGSEFLRRLNLGSEWEERRHGTLASCYKPGGPGKPPFHTSFTSDSYLIMEGGVEVAASRCEGIPGSTTHLAADQFALLYETADGRYSLERGRKLVHVPEDIRFDFVAEDKSKALTDFVNRNFEKDVPILFVHGSYLFGGTAELSWLVQLRRLGGEVEGWPGGFVYARTSPAGEDAFWFLDANYGEPRDE